MLTSSVLICICLFLIGCQSNSTVDSYINIEATEAFLNKEKEVRTYPNIGDDDIFDFAFIKGAPKAEESHDVNEIIKMYSTTWTIEEPHYPLVIDIENSQIYEEADVGGPHGVRFEESRKKVNDIEIVLGLFEKYNVLSWQNYYSNVKDYHSYEDGASWRVLVQYEDGTIETFRGEGKSFEGILPDNYNDFMNELDAYVTGHLEK